MMPQKKPNILFLFADQFRADIMSCAGGPAKTPNLDSIAAEGVLFTDCSTVAPLCVPARVSLFTGKYPHTTGAWDNSPYVLSPEANIWTKEFKKLGYDTSLFGKTHLHTNGGDMVAREWLINGYGFDTVDETAGPHALAACRTHMSDELQAKGLYQAYCDDMHSRGKTPFAKPSALPLADYYDVYVGRKGKEYLENYRGDKPWICHVSFGGPHEPWDTPEPYASMYKKEEMPKPAPRMTNVNPDRPTGEADVQMNNAKIQCNEAQAAEIRADYCGACTLIDDQIGKIIDTIKKRGEWENTIVLFTSDHGEMNGDHGFVNKRNFLHGALNIPMIIRTPETIKNGKKVTDTIVSLLDVGPTLVELAGGKLEYEQFGKSLCGILDGSEEKARDYMLAEYKGEVMYMTKEWKVVLNAKGDICLLFDRVNDPDEQRNLAAAPEAEELSAELRVKVLKALAVNQCLSPVVNQMNIPELEEIRKTVYGAN